MKYSGFDIFLKEINEHDIGYSADSCVLSEQLDIL